MNKTKIKQGTFFLFLLILSSLLLTGCEKATPAVKGSVKGKVYDSNGQAVHNATVERYGGDKSAKTDELGRYFIGDLEPGEQKLVATYDKNSVVKIVEIPRGSTLEGADITFTVVDKLPPLISKVTVTDIKENSALIKWETDEEANAVINYATGTIGLPYNKSVSSVGMTKKHSILLDQLLPGQVYHFKISCTDYHQNVGVSSDYQFTTLQGDPPVQPKELVIADISDMEHVTLEWLKNTENPNNDLVGYNIYRADSLNGTMKRVNIEPIPQPAGEKVYFTDEGLAIAKKYYYMVRAIDLAGNESLPSETVQVLTPGILQENRTWTKAESPYILEGDLRVRGGNVLTIEPGVTVKFATIDKLPDGNTNNPKTELIIQGGLMAVGTEKEPIVFTSADSFPRKGIWNGILFSGSGMAENIMRNCTIMFADTAIKSDNSTPSIENCRIGQSGVAIDSGLSMALNIKNNLIRDNDIGIIAATSNIRNNLFVGNGTSINVMGDPVIEYNTIDGITGIEITAGKPVIKNNIITYTPIKGLFGIKQTPSEAVQPEIKWNAFFNLTTNIENVDTLPETNFEADPLFIGGTDFDYHLQTMAGGYPIDSICLTGGENGSQQGAYGPENGITDNPPPTP